MNLQIVQDLAAWDAAASQQRLALVQSLAPRLLPNFEFIDLRTYSCGGQTHEIAALRQQITGMRFHLLPGGSYLMGQSPRELDRCERLGYTGDLPETPPTRVTVRPFLAAQFYVTEGAWSRMGGDKLHWSFGPDHPADGVSRAEANQWCEEAGLRLPDEKEWEYLCRAGTQSLFYWGDEPDANYAWTRDEPERSDYRNHTASEHACVWNAFGLIDTLGHLTEWVADDLYYYETGIPKEGPYVAVDEKDPDGIQRGGYFHVGWNLCRCSARIQCSDSYGDTGMGFRPVVSLATVLELTSHELQEGPRGAVPYY